MIVDDGKSSVALNRRACIRAIKGVIEQELWAGAGTAKSTCVSVPVIARSHVIHDVVELVVCAGSVRAPVELGIGTASVGEASIIADNVVVENVDRIGSAAVALPQVSMSGTVAGSIDVLYDVVVVVVTRSPNHLCVVAKNVVNDRSGSSIHAPEAARVGI